MTSPSPLAVGVAGGARYGTVTMAAQQALTMLGTAVLARLLTPDDFGVVALAGTVLAACYVVLSVGFGPSLVRGEHPSQLRLHTLFWASCAAAFPLTLGLGALGMLNPFGWEGDFAIYLAVIGLVVLTSVAAGIPAALLLRRLQFRYYYGVQLVATILFVATEIVLARAGLGVLAVAYAQLVLSVVQLAGWSFTARYVPRLRWSASIARNESRFAGSWLSVQTANFVGKNADYWIVGYVLGARALGLYFLAYLLPSVVRQRITTLTSAVAFSVFARLAENPVGTRRVYVRLQRLQLAVLAPALIGLALVATDVMVVLFGQRYREAGIILSWLSLAALCTVLGQGLLQVALAQSTQLKAARAAQVLGSIAIGASVTVGANAAGLVGAAAGVAAGSLVGACLSLVLLGRDTRIPVRVSAAPVLPLVLPLLAMAVTVTGMGIVTWPLPLLVGLLVRCLCGAVVYLAVARFASAGTFALIVADARLALGRRSAAQRAP